MRELVGQFAAGDLITGCGDDPSLICSFCLQGSARYAFTDAHALASLRAKQVCGKCLARVLKGAKKVALAQGSGDKATKAGGSASAVPVR